MSDETDQVNLLKEMIQELKHLRGRVSTLEKENTVMLKAVEDPETLMKRHGWIKAITPHADETYDPLNRTVESDFTDSTSPFSGSGELFTKSRYDELEEWKDAERQVKG
tara:strand:- start:1150 stop:1476 length:327 start_codon:yes stop_codon:yes gene_type:complete